MIIGDFTVGKLIAVIMIIIITHNQLPENEKKYNQ